ncbi:hypothetical protein [Streptomyces sp. NPDC086023]|uniref:hypothetical protein n=1 Tax=Streptomyces sp. NPDC086023 TaxID=3365746 RepID=UPI0037D4BD63
MAISRPPVLGRARPAVLLRALVVLVATFLCLSGAGSAPAVAADAPEWHASVGPPDPIPTDWSGGERVGVDKKGRYCLIERINDPKICREIKPDERPGGIDICEGADGTAEEHCDAKAKLAYELKRLKEWRENVDHGARNYDELNTFLTGCVGKGKPFSDCLREGEGKYPLNGAGPLDWVAGKFSEIASDALQEAANYIGKSVVWLLGEFAKLFNDSSSIDLGQTGIGKPLGITTALSFMVAAFLLLIQFGKLSISQRGEAGATALAGLGKFVVVSSVYLLAAQTALDWSDDVSTWIINFTFEDGGSGESAATEAMQTQLGKMFGGLISGGAGGATAAGALIAGQSVTTAAVGVIIVIGVICIVAIGALWVEILLRQAGIMILLVSMPIAVAGQISDATGDWWPKARNALIALILMKPVITLCFAIGFFAMGESRGVQNVIVGLVIFVLACFSWPVLAKFMTFTSNGGGSSIASGILGSIGSSASSLSGGYRPEMGGAGAVGGGSAYTRALEKEAGLYGPSAGGAAVGGTTVGGAAKGGGLVGAFSVATFGLQLAAAGKDSLESGASSTAAHAGLDHGAAGGRHVVIAPRRPTHDGGPVLQPYPSDQPAGAPLPMQWPGGHVPPAAPTAPPPPRPAPPLRSTEPAAGPPTPSPSPSPPPSPTPSPE